MKTKSAIFLLIQLFVVSSLFAQYVEKETTTTVHIVEIEKQQKHYIITALDGDEYIVIISKRHKKINNSVKITPGNYYDMRLIPCLKNDVIPTMGLRYVIRINGNEVKVPMRGKNIYIAPNLYGLFLTPVTE
jgi:hypothetical protein